MVENASLNADDIALFTNLNPSRLTFINILASGADETTTTTLDTACDFLKTKM